jgi:hypothetical protein
LALWHGQGVSALIFQEKTQKKPSSRAELPFAAQVLQLVAGQGGALGSGEAATYGYAETNGMERS